MNNLTQNITSHMADNFTGAAGGSLMAILTTVQSAEILGVIVYGLIGGFVGIIGKRFGEALWSFITKPRKKKGGKSED